MMVHVPRLSSRTLRQSVALSEHCGLVRQAKQPRQSRALHATCAKRIAQQASGDGGGGGGELHTTDPLLAYRALAAKGVLEEDSEQIRALIELRRLTRVLQDYTPPTHLLGILHGKQDSQTVARVAEVPPAASNDNIHALVRYLSEEQQLESLDTPRGLLLTGKPGTGKTFLVDLWFEHLPVRGKVRRHYHHLLLSIYRMVWVEAERRRIEASDGRNSETALPERGVGAIWEREEQIDAGRASQVHGQRPTKSIAQWAKRIRGMPFMRASSDAPAPVSALDGTTLDDDANKGMDVVRLAQLERHEDMSAGTGTTLPMHVAAQLFLTHGHVLLLDELQLLDIASATLLRRILTSYWRLGGVVVATSNRVPEDLYANNVQRRSLVAFLSALKERCPVVEVQGRDRRIDRWQQGWNKFAQRGEKDGKSFFFLSGVAADDEAFRTAKAALVGQRKAEASMLNVYNRKVAVPEAYSASDEMPSIACYTFDQLCDQPLGPADYLTLSSTYQILILDGVPALDLVHRNQARRLITLIDCLYESRTKLLVRSDVPLTKIFFAREGAQVARENQHRMRMAEQGVPPDQWPAHQDGERTNVEEDLLQSAALIQSEVFSEAMQDTEEGFRPNIAAYGPIVENAHRAEPGRESARQREERSAKRGGMQNLSIFSGEEERFAYQRAVSRLYEMSHMSWSDVTWRPLIEADRSAWQQSNVQRDVHAVVDAMREAAKKSGKRPQSEGVATTANTTSKTAGDTDATTDFAGEASFENLAAEHERRRINRAQGPPVLSPSHVWGVRDDWGPKAGKWGRGVRGGVEEKEQDIQGDDDAPSEDGHESPRERRARLRNERLRAMPS